MVGKDLVDSRSREVCHHTVREFLQAEDLDVLGAADLDDLLGARGSVQRVDRHDARI